MGLTLFYHSSGGLVGVLAPVASSILAHWPVVGANGPLSVSTYMAMLARHLRWLLVKL